MNELVEVVGELLRQPGAVTVEYQKVDNVHKLLLDELPYGTIDPNGIVQGTIEIDGPGQRPCNGKKPLQWHFGGVPYRIPKAIRIEYLYQKYVDGAQISANGSLFIGYEVSSAVEQNGQPAALSMEEQALSVPAVETVTALIDIFQRTFASSPNRVTALARYVDATNFDAFIEEHMPGHSPALAQGTSSSQSPTGPTPLSLRLRTGPANLPPERHLGVRVEYDGPARDYDSKRPFPYTTSTLFNDPSGLYNQLLWWYFGGRAFRITKALRIGYNDHPGGTHQGSLLIGYQGPGPY